MKKLIENNRLLDLRVRIKDLNVQNYLCCVKNAGVSTNRLVNELLSEQVALKGESEIVTTKDLAEQLRIVHQRLNQEIKTSKKRHEELRIVIGTNQLLLSAIYNLLKEQLKLSSSAQSNLILTKLERGLFSMLPEDIEAEQSRQLDKLLEGIKE